MGQLINRHKIISNTMWDDAKIPDEYERLPYIIGDYTASHFDTGIGGDNSNLRIKLCVELNFFVQYYYLFGNYVDETSNCWRLIMATDDQTFYQTSNVRTNASGVFSMGESFVNKKLYFDLQKSRGYLISQNTRYRRTNSNTTGTANTGNIVLGYSHLGNGSHNSARQTKWFYFTAWDDGVMIRNYIPCKRKSDEKAGFYDTVNQTFNVSSGARDFILPS